MGSEIFDHIVFVPNSKSRSHLKKKLFIYVFTRDMGEFLISLSNT